MVIAAAVFLCACWPVRAAAELFDGSGFEAVNWNMRIADAEKAMGSRASRVRNQHTGYEYLRASPYDYLGCPYVLVLNFDKPGGPLSEIVLTYRRDANPVETELACRDGLSSLRQKLGTPISLDEGIRVWRLKTTTITVVEGRRGDVQIRYKPNDDPARRSDLTPR